MRNTTLVFLYKPEEQRILLAMKKRGFGQGRWNGVGGKLNEGETIRDASVREAEEEISVKIKPTDLEQVAVLDFSFEHRSEYDQQVHVFFATEWVGEPIESEEMKPQWFLNADIPYAEMWPDDIFWLPQVLEGNGVRATFTFGENDTITNQHVQIVERGSLK